MLRNLTSIFESIPTLSLNLFILTLIKPYKGLLLTMALIGLLWAFTNTFSPYVLKLIIDHVISFKGNKADLFKVAEPYIFGYIALWLGMDRILVFDNGEIIEDGTHEMLIAKENGHYATMWRMQAGGFLPESVPN